jgi:uncharacterized membrane protein
MTSMRLLVRAAIFGAAVGGRASLAFAGPVLARAVAARTGRTPASPRTVAAIAAATALGGETVADKLPATPSRLDPPVLAGRVAAAVAGAVVLARRERAGVMLPVVAAVLGALAEVTVGVKWRSFTRKRGRAVVGAVVEDAVVLTLALVACWPRRGAGGLGQRGAEWRATKGAA